MGAWGNINTVSELQILKLVLRNCPVTKYFFLSNMKRCSCEKLSLLQCWNNYQIYVEEEKSVLWMKTVFVHQTVRR